MPEGEPIGRQDAAGTIGEMMDMEVVVAKQGWDTDPADPQNARNYLQAKLARASFMLEEVRARQDVRQQD